MLFVAVVLKRLSLVRGGNFFFFILENVTRASVVPNDLFLNDLVFFLSKFVLLIWTWCLRQVAFK